MTADWSSHFTKINLTACPTGRAFLDKPMKTLLSILLLASPLFADRSKPVYVEELLKVIKKRTKSKVDIYIKKKGEWKLIMGMEGQDAATYRVWVPRPGIYCYEEK